MNSLRGFEWVLPPAEERKILHYMQGANLSEFVARILVARGIEYNQISDFLNPSLKRLLPDPYILLDMQTAALQTADALIAGHKIVIYGDYDVDGATSSALLRYYLRDIGKIADLYIPDRLDEGYGANAEALLALAKKGFSLCLMVDCGTTAFDALAVAKKNGLNIIVLDHHMAETKLPDASAVVNPNRIDQELGERNDLKYLCAAGVAYLFIIALNRCLRERGYFNAISEPDLLQYLDLVALGTVCDVMPLKGLNRAFVAQGLKVAKKRNNLGFTTLADIAELKNGVSSAYHFGFVLGPRINAGGRVGQADLGSTLLYTNDRLQAQEIATKLNAYNLERQLIESQVLEEAIAQVVNYKLDERSVIMVLGENWHPGVIGIVASRLKDRFHKPTLVVTNWKNEMKGSGRSVSGLDMGSMMHKALHKKILIKGGGHAMAAGFTIVPDSYDDFYNFLDDFAKPILKDRKNILTIDGFLSIDSLNVEFFNELSKLEPYGSGHPSPTIAIKNVRAVFCDVVGEQHIRATLQDETGKRLKAIAFRSVETPLKELLEYKGTFDVAGTVKLDNYNGSAQLQIIIDDVILHR